MLPENYFRRIGVDCDDVLVDFMGGLIDWHNQNYGTQLAKKGFADGSTISSLTGISWEEGTERVMKYIQLLNAGSTDLNIIPGSRDVLNYLQKQGFNLSLVTARTTYSQDATLNEVRIKFPGTFNEVYFSINKKLDANAPRISKAQICKEKSLEIIIEDNSRNALECADAGIYVLLFDQPWNQKCPEHPNIKRVRSWAEVALSI